MAGIVIRESPMESQSTSMVVEMVPIKGGIGSIWGLQGSARTTSGI